MSADASSFGIGTVLFRVQEDGRRAPVTYISRSLPADEERFSQIEKEALAMVWACEKLHCYVFGTERPFLIETDHRPLESIMNRQSIDECPPRSMRLKLRMMRYCFRVEYVPGKKLAVADASSRAPVEQADNEIASLVEKHVQIFEEALQGSNKQIQRLRDETGKDPQLAALLECSRLGLPHTQKELRHDIQEYRESRHLLTEIRGLILRGVKMVIPKSTRAEMLQRAHEGHLGVVETLSRVREVIWWPRMSNAIRQMIEHCETCTEFRPQQKKEPLQPTRLPRGPWDKVAIDLFELKNVQYLLSVDYYSRFPDIRTLSSTRAETVISALKDIFRVVASRVW